MLTRDLAQSTVRAAELELSEAQTELASVEAEFALSEQGTNSVEGLALSLVNVIIDMKRGRIADHIVCEAE
eukprot:13750469-Heterocapsa_arctica.AAC.1